MSFQKPKINVSLSTEDIRDYKLKLAHLTNNMDDFVIQRMKYHVNDLIVDKITDAMERERFSPKIIQNTYLKEVNITGEMIRAKVVSEYSSESGFDVAVAREKGTKGHMIRPNTKQALSWISAGVRFFSKGHWVSGIKSLNLVRNTIRDNKEKVQQAVEKDFADWEKQILG